ncbi:hypothetical protein V2W45_1501321 [Cenococcum geophilum]
MILTRSVLDLPNQSASHFVHTISNLLTAEECTSTINQHDSSLIPTSAAYSTRLRHIFDDDDLARLLWARLEPFYADQCCQQSTDLIGSSISPSISLIN